MKRLQHLWAKRGQAGYAVVGASVAVALMAVGVSIGTGLRTGSSTALPGSDAAPSQSIDMRHAAPNKRVRSSSPAHRGVPVQSPDALQYAPQDPVDLDALLPVAVAWDPDDPLPPMGAGPLGADAYLRPLPNFDAPLPPDDSVDQMLARLRLDEPLPPR